MKFVSVLKGATYLVVLAASVGLYAKSQAAISRLTELNEPTVSEQVAQPANVPPATEPTTSAVRVAEVVSPEPVAKPKAQPSYSVVNARTGKVYQLTPVDTSEPHLIIDVAPSGRQLDFGDAAKERHLACRAYSFRSDSASPKQVNRLYCTPASP